MKPGNGRTMTAVEAAHVLALLEDAARTQPQLNRAAIVFGLCNATADAACVNRRLKHHAELARTAKVAA